MNYGKTTNDSASIPGVRFTLRRLGPIPQAEIGLKTLADRQRQREITNEYPLFTPEETDLRQQITILQKKAAAVPSEEQPAVLAEMEELLKQLAAVTKPEIQKKRQNSDEEYAALEMRIQPHWVRAALVSMEGKGEDGKLLLEVDGKQMTPEQLLEFGPTELADEIYSAILADSRLSAEQAKNSQSRTTSFGPAGTTTSSTSADPASSGAGTTAAIASVGSPAT